MESVMKKSVFIAGIVVLIAGAFMLGWYADEVWESMRASAFGQRAGIAGFAVLNAEENVTQLYALSTALCGTDNRCIDVLVHCNGTQILNVTPISSLVWHDDGWEDPRGGNPKALCPGKG